MNLFYKAICKSIAYYRKVEEKTILKKIPFADKKNIYIQYPYNISYPELISIGEDTTILSNVRLNNYSYLTDKECKLAIGKHCYFGNRLCILVAADVKIGNNVLIASDVTIVSHNHGIDPESKIPYMDQPLQTAEVTIEDNCWIGDKVIVLGGVTIGSGSIIGAGSIVTKSIPPLSIAVGNPARVIKRYDMETHEWKKV